MELFKKILKILGYIVLSVVVLLVIASIVIDPYVKDYLEKEINAADEGQYSAEIDKVNISILRGNFIIEGIHLVTDTLVARENETPVIVLDAKEISVEGVSWLDFLLTNNLQLDKMSMLDLVVEAKVRTVAEDTVDTGPFKWEDLDIYPMIKDQVDQVRLSDLRFGNIDLTLINVESADTLRFDAEEFNIFSDDILVDADRVFTDGRSLFASEIDIQGKNVTVDRVGNPQFQVFLELIEFETRENKFSMLSENARFLKKGDTVQDTVLFGFAQEFNFSDLNLNKVQEDSVANINSIFLSHLTLVNNMPLDEEEVKRAAAAADKKTPGFDVTKFSLGDNLPELLDKITIDEITLENIHYRQLDIMDVSSITFVTRDMLIDKNPAFSDNRFLHASKFTISIDSLNYFDEAQLLQINLDKFNINIEEGTGSLGINTLTAQHTKKRPGEIYAEAKINGFNISGIDTRNLTDKTFSIDSISIEFPRFMVEMPKGGGEGKMEQNAGPETPLDFYPAIADFLDELQVNKIALIKADIQISGMEEIEGTVRLPAVYLQVSDLLIAEGTAFSGNRVLHADDIAVRVERIEVPLLEGTHKAELDLFRLSTREGFLEFQGISYATKKDVDQMLTDSDVSMVMQMSSEQFKISKLDFAALIQEKGFYAEAISLNGLDVEIFGDLVFLEVEAEKAAKEAEKELELDFSEFTLADMLPDNFGKVKIGSIVLQDINLRHEDKNKVEGLEFSIQKVQIDQRPAFAENRFLHAEAFRFSVDTLSFLEEEQMLRVAFSDMELNIEKGTGNFELNNITANHSERIPGEMYMEAAIEGFHIMGINTREMTNKKFSIDSVAIAYPKILADLAADAVDPDTSENAGTAAQEDMDLYSAISNFLNELQINKIAIIEADFAVDGLADRTARLPAVYLQVSDLLIAEGTAFQNDRVLHTADVAVRLERIDFPLPDNVNRVELELFEMSTREGFLHANGFVYDYNDNFREIMEGPETNMVFKVANDKFSIKGLDFGLLAQQKGVFADSILVGDGLNVEVFVDNHYEAEEAEDLPSTIQQLIKEIEMPLYLRALKVNNAHIIYEELAKDGDEPGKFWLEDMNLAVINLTNVDQKISDNPETTISLNTKLMGDGYFNTGLKIPMNDLLAPVNFSGRLDDFDLTQLNRYTEYTSLFGFESGTMYTLLWDFEAGNKAAKGIFGLSYENLNIQLSESESPKPAGTLFQIGSYLANALILDEDKSEDKSEPPKTVDFERDKDDGESFIEHYVASLMAGFLEIMGFPLSIINP